MVRRVVICADDYGLAPGVSRAIRDLAAARRLSATSVMTVFPGLAREAVALDDVRRARASEVLETGTGAFGIGLHLTLTGGFQPLTAAPLKGECLPSLSELIRASLLRRLDLQAVEREIEAQFLAFFDLFGRPPDHVDGHQHSHLLPGIRSLALAATARHAPRAWIRDCTPAPGTGLGLNLKGRLIGVFSLGLARDARARGIAVNRGFAGAYDFSGAADFRALLERALAFLPQGGVMMVHPGYVDDMLAQRDPVTEPRAAEFAVLAELDLPDRLIRLGLRLEHEPITA